MNDEKQFFLSKIQNKEYDYVIKRNIQNINLALLNSSRFPSMPLLPPLSSKSRPFLLVDIPAGFDDRSTLGTRFIPPKSG